MKLCALIVDDQPESVKVIKATLELQGVFCAVAKNTQEATQMLRQYLPHILIVDISLGPEENGLKWLEDIRKETFKHLPAIIMTSSAMLEDVQKSIELGVQDYVIKPPNPNVLKKKILALLEHLQAHKPYVYSSATAPADAKIEVKGRISGVSETGLCLSTHVTNKNPLSFENVKSTIFTEMGIEAPKKITFLNYEKENNRGPYPIRNYCQAKGWVESDFIQIRLWIRRSKLVRDF